MSTPLSTTDAKALEYWKETAEKRIRLAWAAFAVGIIIGFAFYAICAVEPAWVGELNCRPI